MYQKKKINNKAKQNMSANKGKETKLATIIFYFFKINI